MRAHHRLILSIPGCLCLAFGCDAPKAEVAPPKPPAVIVSAPVTDEIIDYEDFTGRTEAVYSIEVRARVTGYLDKVYFHDGDEVKEGDVLIQIDPRPYVAMLAQMDATIQQGAAHLNRLDADFRRAKNLFSRNSIGREEFDKIAGDRAEAEALVGVAKASRELAQLNVKFTKITAPITGRLSRRLVDPGNLVKADDTILTSIVSLDPMYVYFDVDERTLLRLRRLVREGKVKTRQEAVVPVLIGLSDEDGYPHLATINFSDNKVDPSTGTLRVRGVIENPPVHERSTVRVFSPGLFTRVRLPVGSPHRELLIPEEAIGTDQGRKYLYVVKDAPRGGAARSAAAPSKADGVSIVEDRTVVLGPSQNGLRVISKGLKAGEMVIVSGLQRVRPGAKVLARVRGGPKRPASEATASR